MIPLKLQIKNFLSYGPELQTIHFEPYQLICLSGKNGHGKSALLDAITWVLWGQARKISGNIKADEGLVRLGETQMLVILDFECSGQKYRIRREYAKTYGKPYTALDFGMYRSDNTLIQLTEKKIRETQKKIENTIHLTLESFTNSAFLRQGQANEFSKKSPKERKEIFAQILSLQQYEVVKKLAIDKVKYSNLKINNLKHFHEKIETELSKKELINSKINEIKSKLTDITTRENLENKKQKKLSDKRKQLSEDQKNFQIINFQFEQLLKKEKEKQAELLDIRSKWRAIHKKKLQYSNRAILEEKKNKLSTQINIYQKMLQKQLKLKEQSLQNKEKIHIIEKNFYEEFNKKLHTKKLETERLRIKLSTEEKNLKNYIKKQNEKTNEKQLINEKLKKLQDKLYLNIINKKELERENKQFERRKEYYQKYITQGNWIKRELDGLEQKQLLSQDEGNPSCPLCEQNLSASRKRFLKAKFTKKKQFLIHRFARLSKIIKNLKEKLISQHNIINKLKKTEEKNKLAEIQITELEKTLKSLTLELEKTTTNIEESKKIEINLSKNLDTSIKESNLIEREGHNRLGQNTEYKNLLKSIELDDNKIKNINYDENKHKETSTLLKNIEKQLTEYDKISEQITLQEERKKNIHELCLYLKEIKIQKKELSSKMNQYRNLKDQQEKIEILEQSIDKNVKNINLLKEQFLQEKGSLENQKSKLKILEKEYNNQKITIESLVKESQDYQLIANATGKDGIQALLIENAIPEIEQEANSILSKLTNNQAQIFIESLRDLKKGGTKETLDIKISDSVGIRQYELFSGGEAFRIDFALRIAISKLLARRSGTALQTLIIDEGFGSQDEEGLCRIMDAIYKIQDNFSKIIIVSHLSTMKNQFPTHFFIEKGPNGSKVKIIEQG